MLKKIFICVLMFMLVFSENVLALSKHGSQGDEVIKIQTRLKNWGYYSGGIDGIYGSRTESAVKAFQRKNGLTADGICGSATLEKIGLPSKASSGSSYDANITLLAKVINGEARGESYEGQVAVGAVIMNRVKHSSFPNTISGVIYQKGAFDAVSDGQMNVAVSSSCYKAAREAMNGWDPSGGAIYYYNPATATSSWIWTRPVIKQIGNHVFCK